MVKLIASLFVGLTLFFVVPKNADAYYTNMPASVVVGQNDLVSTSSNVTQSGLKVPDDAIVIQGKLIIADQQADRVLIWNTVPTSNGKPADVVIGQSDFTSEVDNSGGISNKSLLKPSALATDGTKLLIADRNNNRILIFNSVPTTNFAGADYVIGQVDFTHVSSNQGGTAGSNTVARPDGLFFDGQRLFVGDVNNNRVLIFNSIPSSNNASANIVLGQAAFNTVANGVTASTMWNPHGLFSDGTRLVVTEESNMRILIWNTIPTTNGKAADVVLGQTSFATRLANQGGTMNAGTIDTPAGQPSIVGNRLFVPDSANNRLLIWNTIPTTNGASADVVIGSANFTTSGSVNAACAFSYGNKLIVCDGNNRILIYDNVSSSPKTTLSSVSSLVDSRFKAIGNLKLGERSKYSIQSLQAKVNGEGFSDVTYHDGGRDDGADSTIYDFYHEFSPWAGNGTKDTWGSNGYTINFKASSNNAEEDNLFYFYPFKLTSAVGNTFAFDGPKTHWQKLKDNINSFVVKYQKSGSPDWETLESGVKLTDSIFDSITGKITLKTLKTIPLETSNVKIISIDNSGHEQESNTLSMSTTSALFKTSNQKNLVLMPSPTPTPSTNVNETQSQSEEAQEQTGFLANIVNSIKEFLINIFRFNK